MIVLDNDWSNFKSVDPIAVTIGTFDGVHVGHQQILKKVTQKAKQINAKSAVLTFSIHPKILLNPLSSASLNTLQTISEKLQAFEDAGIDYVFFLDYIPNIFEMDATSFIEDLLLNKLDTKYICIGYDHKFGKDRKGDVALLEKYQDSFELVQIPVFEEEEIAVSSTLIRQYLLSGNIIQANKLLGRSFPISGVVIQGDQWGRTIGFPTANIQIADNHKIIPKIGIYAVEVQIEGDSNVYQGMFYIGNRPSFEGDELRLEVNIFQFNKEIYGKKIEVFLKSYIRDDQKVSNLNELKILLKQDQQSVEFFFDQFPT
jgi:riboflavin kinase/FMN adenylyltransferase